MGIFGIGYGDGTGFDGATDIVSEEDGWNLAYSDDAGAIPYQGEFQFGGEHPHYRLTTTVLSH